MNFKLRQGSFFKMENKIIKRYTKKDGSEVIKIYNNKKYNDTYYLKNKLKLNEKYLCNCGINVNRSNKHNHEKTKKHIKLLNNKNLL